MWRCCARCSRPTPTRTNRFGGIALIPAADRGHVECVREILKTKIDVDHVNKLGWTALLEAIILATPRWCGCSSSPGLAADQARFLDLHRIFPGGV